MLIKTPLVNQIPERVGEENSRRHLKSAAGGRFVTTICYVFGNIDLLTWGRVVVGGGGAFDSAFRIGPAAQDR
jgi:hypothetical protein